MNIFHKVLELWPGHESGTYGRSNRRGHKNARVVFLVHDTSAQCHAYTCIVSWIYSIRFRSNGPDTVYYMELNLRGNNSKTKNARFVFLVHDTSSYCDVCTCIVSWIYSIQFRSYGPDTVYYMQLRQGKIIQKQKMQELSSLFMTHRVNVMHALVKFHEYIPYSLGVMARTRLTIWNLVKGK